MKLRALALLALFFYSSASLALNINITSVKKIARTYGFVFGQEYTLSRIAKEFPELTGSVEITRLEFDSKFPDIGVRLEKEIKQIAGEKFFQESIVNPQIKAKDALGRQELTKESAENYLQLVKARAKGEIESPMLEYLLALKYEDYPVGEFTDGFLQSYKTDGLGKSQGIKVNLQLPRSWLKEDGKRPHVVQKWTSENGTGTEMIVLSILDAQGYSPTKKDMEKFIQSGEVKGAVLEGGSYIASGIITLERQNGYWFQMSMPVERAGMKMYQNMLAYELFFRGKAIEILCVAGGPEKERVKIDNVHKRIQPLCQQVLNSVVLPQVY